MDTIATGMASGLAVLFVSSLGWLAYNHPNRFLPMSTPLCIVAFCMICGLIGYYQGVINAAKMQPGAWDKLKVLLVPSYWIYLLTGFIFYVTFLKNFVTNWKVRNVDGDESANKRGRSKP